MVEIESLVDVTEVAAIVVVAEKKKDLYWQLIETSLGIWNLFVLIKHKPQHSSLKLPLDLKVSLKFSLMPFLMLSLMFDLFKLSLNSSVHHQPCL